MPRNRGAFFFGRCNKTTGKRYTGMKPFGRILFMISLLAVIFVFSGAAMPSARKFRIGLQWYLDQVVDSAGFFALDTLRFIDPDPGLFQVITITNGVSDRDTALDSLYIYPDLMFRGKPRNEFSIAYNCHQIKTQRGLKEWGCDSELRGRFRYKRKERILRFDFYKEKECVHSDDLDDQVKYATKEYRVIAFSKSEFTLARLKQ